MSEKRRQYKNPPIEEALCQLRFAPGPAWDWTIPGRLHSEVKEQYSGKPREVKQLQAGVQMQAPDTPGAVQVSQGLAMIQFPSSDGKRLVAVGPDVLSVHILRPYSKWEDFRQRISDAVSAYVRIAEPVGVKRIGVRYMNRIVFDSESINLPEYFVRPPITPDDFPPRLSNIFSRSESAYEDEPYRLIFTFATAGAPEGRAAFVVDLDVIWMNEEHPLPLEEVMTMVEDLRARERVAFEAFITDRSREMFDAS